MIRLTFVLRRDPNLSRAAFQQYWREVHGPLVAKHATTLNILRYVQAHTLEDPINAQLAEARGAMEPPYDGVAELWWTNREALVTALGTAAGQAAATEQSWWRTKDALSIWHTRRCGLPMSIHKSIPRRRTW